MKKILFIASLLISNFCFSQARQILSKDTATGMPIINKDTVKTIQADSPVVVTAVSPYKIKFSLSSGFTGGLWTKNTTYTNKAYVGHDINTITNVGIGTDTAHSPLQIKTPLASGTWTDSSGITLSNDSASTATKNFNSPALTFQSRAWGGTGGDKVAKISLVGSPASGSPTNLPGLSLYGLDASSNTPIKIAQFKTSGFGGPTPTGSLTIGPGGSAGAININATANQIDVGSASGYFTISNGGAYGVKTIGYTNQFVTNYNGFLAQIVNSVGQGLAVNDYSSQTFGDTSTIADFASTTGLKGFLIPRTTTNKRDSITGAARNVSITTAGSAYTNGTYTAVAITGGSGTGAKANITVSGGIITAATIPSNFQGINYIVGDVFTVPALGGTGSGGTLTVTKAGVLAANVAKGLIVQDTSVNQLSIHNTGNSWTGKVFNSSASTLTLDYGDDYIFSGTTATYTLPAILTNTQGRQNAIVIKNRGSGTITLNAASGSTIYTTSAVSTINIIAGAACELLPDGTYFNVLYNN